MLISKEPPIHLTYCMNVHPGERWADQETAVREQVRLIRGQVAPREFFGLGLRIAKAGADDLAGAEERKAAQRLFRENDLYPFTINGFPFGAFHGTAVKERVYLPDWTHPERRDYTCHLADILAEWIPEGMSGSISTVPGSYKPWINRVSDISGMIAHLVDAAWHLFQIREKTGREIHLGLEPEPDCYLETTPETVQFFTKALIPEGVGALVRRAGVSKTEAEEIIRRHLGVCLDTCHVALQFEDLAESWRSYRAAGIRISKVQLSNALEVGIEAAAESLSRFVEPVYLHQVKARRRDGSIASWPDLPMALPRLADADDLEMVRVHFHVPLFWEGGSTAHCLTPDFFRLLRGGDCSHIEIETYTFDVLPEEIKPTTLAASVAEEYRWVMKKVGYTSAN